MAEKIDNCSYEVIEEIAQYLMEKAKFDDTPKLGIILGSGLGELTDRVENKIVISYQDIPHFPTSTVAGHDGQLVFGSISGVSLVCMKGRFHTYEGYSFSTCAMPVRVMKLLGVSTLVITNAAGGLNRDYKVGDIMLIKDHIDLPGTVGFSPLRGPNDERFGSRFIDMRNAYDKHLRETMKEVASELNLGSFLKEGVYYMSSGPSFDSDAMYNFQRVIGVDATGMSTIPEVVFAKHCGMKVLAFSLITDTPENTEELDHDQVLSAANERKDVLIKLLSKFVSRLYEKKMLS